MSMELITVIFFGATFGLLLTGLPLAFVLCTVGMGMALWLWGTGAASMIYYAANELLGFFMLIALPMFLFMGLVLQKSGIADDLYETVYRWMGHIRGGLGMGTILICTIIAAMVGISEAATITLGLIALPSMLKRKYDKLMVTGAIQAGGALGFLIPPSAIMILYSLIARTSLGRLFVAGMFPGLMLSFFYIAYIGIRCQIQPHLGPALPPEEKYTWKQKIDSLKSLIMPVILVFIVLGLIIMGVTSPTEAAAVGALGSLAIAAVYRRLTWQVVREASYGTARVCGFIAWLLVGALVFSKVYDGLGASHYIQEALSGLDIGRWGILLLMQFSFFIMGMLLDDAAILFICMPVYLPIAASQGFDPTWFGILYVINVQMALLTPPYGLNLYFLKTVAPKEISLGDIYRSVWPFVALQGLCLMVVMIFPQIALWLPNKVFG